MSNNQNPFSYVPTISLLTPPNNKLRHIRLLPAVWNPTTPVPNWSEVQKTINLNKLRKERKDYYHEHVEPYLYERILNNPKINSANKNFLQKLFFNYYESALSPSNYGVYIDGKGLLEEIKNKDDSNGAITNLLTRYAYALTTACMFGVINANNERTNGQFSARVALAKSTLLDICALPLNVYFDPTNTDDCRKAAREVGFSGPLAFFPFEQLKGRITTSLGQTLANEIDFVNDLISTSKYIPTDITDYWLPVFTDELNKINPDNNNYGLYLGRK